MVGLESSSFHTLCGISDSGRQGTDWIFRLIEVVVACQTRDVNTLESVPEANDSSSPETGDNQIRTLLTVPSLQCVYLQMKTQSEMAQKGVPDSMMP